MYNNLKSKQLKKKRRNECVTSDLNVSKINNGECAGCADCLT